MTRCREAVLGLAVLLGSVACAVLPAGAAGPWRGQVVDAETNQPLEGVVVLAVWDKISPGTVHQRREFHDVDEVVTDADGRFVLPSRSLLTANPFVSIDGPNLHMFKAGYGRWGERGLPRYADRDDVRRLMQKEGMVFEVPPLLTREERRNYSPYRPSHVPNSRIPRFLEEINRERISLGLQPFRVGDPGANR